MKSKYPLFIIFLCVAGLVAAQETPSNRYRLPESPAAYPYMSPYMINQARIPLYLPEVEGFTILKCDFHLHTVFSDGNVWPVTRVQEAFFEGLDAIAITDHFEFHHLNKNDVHAMEDYNREYEIAKRSADELGVLLVPGLEITREVPTGHYNMLFIEDANQLRRYINPDNPRDTTTIEETLAAGKALGGFTTWNHPPYQNPNGAEWKPVQQRLYDKKLIMGIEIINSGMYVPLAHQWADEKGLTKMSTTDSHGCIRLRDGFHRAMTFVFAKDRSVAAIKEALFKGLTVGYAFNYLYGKEELLLPIFKNSLKTRVLRRSDKEVAIEVRNVSGIPFELELIENDQYRPSTGSRKITLYGNETIALVVLKQKNATKFRNEIQVMVNNLQVHADKPLHTTISF